MAYKVGVVGLGVMGSNLARNMESKGFPVAGYDLDTKKVAAFLQGSAKGQDIIGVDTPQRLMEVLERPRRILYYDAHRSERLPANLTQAQRDFFGAHTYRRVDREGSFHTDWSAKV